MSCTQDEIRQQPETLRELLAQEIDPIREIVAELRQHDIRYVLIVARGTSDNAARYAKYLFGSQLGLQVALATPSLFTLYDQPPKLESALVIGVSQSGQSEDIVSVLAEAQRQRAPTLAVTNYPDSPLANHADHIINLHAGVEQAVAATKTYTAQLTALALLTAVWLDVDDRLDEL
ncbi:MAG: SIS domain-containing protein, partial [Anaerolineales bacterium]|nr:SIS domain-containing protein [Anaerolineales bacterium]